MTAAQSPRRRALLQAALGLGALAPLAGLSLAGQAAPGSPRLVLMILRGGLDGLSAVPAIGDPAFADARGALGRFAQPLLPLDPLFALHPALGGLHARWTAGELLVLHATGLGTQDRSHFDAQQVLESGGQRPFALDTGWLGRALAGGHSRGMAFQSAVPLALRGHAEVDTWAPSARPEPAPDLVARIERLYASDAPLASALARARELRGDLPAGSGSMTGMANAGGRFAPVALARQAAGFLAKPDGPQVAVLELNGWTAMPTRWPTPGRWPITCASSTPRWQRCTKD